MEQRDALNALGEMKDASYAPALFTLREHSRDRERKAQLFRAAARLDPARAMPVAEELLKSSQEEDRTSAIDALAATEQPEALPRLVHALHDPAFRVRSAAAYALVALTRTSPSPFGFMWTGQDPASEFDFWSSWLRTHPDLPIHLTRECPQATKP